MNVVIKEFKIYQIANKNVFGFFARIHGLKNTLKSFAEYDEAEQWIATHGIATKEYIILEVLKKGGIK